MFRTYVQHDPYSPLIAFGHRVATLSKALERAKRLRAHQCEIRDESKPRSRSLVSIFVDGVEIGA